MNQVMPLSPHKSNSSPSSSKIPSSFSMFLSSAGFHPGISATTRKASARLRKFSSLNKAPSPPRSPSTSVNTNSCQLVLLSLLQGSDSSTSDRMRVVTDIDVMSSQQKDNLVDFLIAENGASTCTIVNNACKLFRCSPTELGVDVVEKDPLQMVSLWQKLHQDIIPVLQSILYPLRKHDPSFDIRRCLLVAFRDRVLAKCISPSHPHPEWESMFFTILLETENDSLSYREFSETVNQVIGNKQQKSQRGPGQPLVKCRSKTLPNKGSKRVSFNDEARKSATFSD